MENKAALKTIWNKLNALQIEIGQLIELDKVETVFKDLAEKEKLRGKEIYWHQPKIISMWLMMGLIAFSPNLILGFFPDFIQIIGYLLTIVGMIWLTHHFNSSKIPFKENSHEASSIDFLKKAKTQLLKRKKADVFGPIGYGILLFSGIYMMLFNYLQLINSDVGFLLGITGASIGIVAALVGSTVHFQKKQFDKNYNEILCRIDTFLAKNEF